MLGCFSELILLYIYLFYHIQQSKSNLFPHFSSLVACKPMLLTLSFVLFSFFNRTGGPKDQYFFKSFQDDADCQQSLTDTELSSQRIIISLDFITLGMT